MGYSNFVFKEKWNAKTNNTFGLGTYILQKVHSVRY